MWIARDKDGSLTLFSEKPIRIDNNDDMWLSFVWHPENVHTCKRMQLNSSKFSNLTWEDEPLECNLIAAKRMKACPKCGKRIWYSSDDIHYDSCEQPSSGYVDEWEWIECPECKEKIEI